MLQPTLLPLVNTSQGASTCLPMWSLSAWTHIPRESLLHLRSCTWNKSYQIKKADWTAMVECTDHSVLQGAGKYIQISDQILPNNKGIHQGIQVSKQFSTMQKMVFRLFKVNQSYKSHYSSNSKPLSVLFVFLCWCIVQLHGLIHFPVLFTDQLQGKGAI